MKIDVARLEQMLKLVGVIKGTKPYLDPVKLVFQDDGVWVRQSDASKTLGVVAFFPKDFFNDYGDFRGEIIIPVKSTYKLIRKVFKDSIEVELIISEGKYSIIGKSAEITDSLMSVEIVDIPGEIKKYRDVFYSENFGSIVFYGKTEYNYFAELECDSDLTFKTGDKGLSVECTLVTANVKKSIPSVIEDNKEPVTVKVDKGIFEMVVKAIKSSFDIAFTKTTETVGPVIIGSATDTYTVSYWLVPKIGD